MPEHDLEPPRFSRRAFERLLSDWPAVKGMIMTGIEVILLIFKIIRNYIYIFFLNINISKIIVSLLGTKEERDWKQPLYEEQAYLNAQNGSALLDKFTHCLLVKCGTEVVLLMQLSHNYIRNYIYIHL